MNTRLSIEVHFDFICPWCLIGERQLQRAVQKLRREQPLVEVELKWRGVQLLPQLPADGEPFEAFYQERLGSEQAVRQRQAEVRSAAQAVGEDIDFARIPRMPNTADAHRLLQRAMAVGTPAQAEALRVRLMRAYFHEGEDIGDFTTLLELAQACGLPVAQLGDCLLGDGSPFDQGLNGVVGGVPHFRFNQQRGFSGAYPADVLLASMNLALERAAWA